MPLRVRRRCTQMLAAAAAVSAGTACDKIASVSDTDVKVLSTGQAKALWDRQQRGMKDQVLFIDPRPAKYYNASHIPGAEHIELPRFDIRDPEATRDPRLDSYANLVVYGDNPGDPVAKGMAKRLLEFRYKHVRWFAGGMKDWTVVNFPTEGTGVVPSPTPPPATPASPDTKPTEPAAGNP